METNVGLQNLYAAPGLAKLAAAHVCIVGLGGVGSWAAEALARTGVGTLTLIDPDAVCTSNLNRQLPALHSTVGQQKTDVLQARIKAINPKCTVRTVQRYVTEANIAEIFETFKANQPEAPKNNLPTHVLDAIDNVCDKAALLAHCKTLGIFAVCCGGAAGRTHINQLHVADLTQTRNCRMSKLLRKRLRQHHGFSRDEGLFAIPTVYSAEPLEQNRQLAQLGNIENERADENCSVNGNHNNKNNNNLQSNATHQGCDDGLGSAMHITATMGLMAAEAIIENIVG